MDIHLEDRKAPEKSVAMSAWIEYKRERAMSFVRQGLSVSWSPDGSPFMEVFTPPRPYSEFCHAARVKFDRTPSQFGIEGGAVLRLRICRFGESLSLPLRDADGETVFNYDRENDVDLLDGHPEARKLRDAILRELNRLK